MTYEKSDYNLKSFSFSAPADQEIPIIKDRLIRAVTEFFHMVGPDQEILGSVHSLTFPSTFSDESMLDINAAIGQLYHQFSCPVLGGDTSKGEEFVWSVTLMIWKKTVEQVADLGL